jgi:hypothetical protein
VIFVIHHVIQAIEVVVFFARLFRDSQTKPRVLPVKIADIESRIETFLKGMLDKASPGDAVVINAVRGQVGLVIGVAKQKVKQVIESGAFTEFVNELAQVAKDVVSAELPGWLGWVPFLNPTRVIDKMAAKVLGWETEIAIEVGATVHAIPASK